MREGEEGKKGGSREKEGGEKGKGGGKGQGEGEKEEGRRREEGRKKEEAGGFKVQEAHSPQLTLQPGDSNICKCDSILHPPVVFVHLPFPSPG